MPVACSPTCDASYTASWGGSEAGEARALPKAREAGTRKCA